MWDPEYKRVKDIKISLDKSKTIRKVENENTKLDFELVWNSETR